MFFDALTQPVQLFKFLEYGGLLLIFMALLFIFAGVTHLSFLTESFIYCFRFPTLYWVPKNAKDKPIPYSGGREVNDFIKFIAEHSTDGLKGYSRDGSKKKKKKSEL